MCSGAIILSRIKSVIYGCKELRHGADGSFVDVLGKKHPIHNVKVKSGLLEQESKRLVQKFFQQRRREKKCLK